MIVASDEKGEEMLKGIKKIGKKAKARLFVKTHESETEDKVKYMFLKRKSDALLVIFSAFTGENRRYNYFSSLKNEELNQLYILDTWGHRGSYYWYEGGSDEPEKQVQKLISEIVNNNNIKYIYTAGTSKGGTAAIYFGLLMNAKNIFAGACQYRVGTYLNREEHREVLHGMMGKQDDNISRDILDDKIENLLQEQVNKTCNIHIFYSRKELTYERQIIPLIEALKVYGYNYEETINDFPKHDDVGFYFPSYLHFKLEEIRERENKGDWENNGEKNI